MADYNILIRGKDEATNEFERVRGAIKRISLSTQELGNSFGFTEGKYKRFYGKLIGFGAVAGIVTKTIDGMKKELSDSVKAYEEFAHATNVPDENLKRLDELKEKHELMRIEIGQKLLPYWMSLQEAATMWLSGVGILIDKMNGLKGVRAGVENKVESDIQGEIDKLSTSAGMYGDPATLKRMANLRAQLAYAKSTAAGFTSESVLNPKTQAERDALEKAERERLRKAEERRKLDMENAWFDYEQQKKLHDKEAEEAKRNQEELARVNKEIEDTEKKLHDKEAEEAKRNEEELARVNKEIEDNEKQLTLIKEREAQRRIELAKWEREQLYLNTTTMVSQTISSAHAIVEISRVQGREKKRILEAIAIAEGAAAAVTAIKAGWDTGVTYWDKAALAIAGGVQAGLQTGAEIVAINAQSFAGGGIVGGSSFYGDNVHAKVNSGEMILNAAQQARLYGMASGSTTNNSSSVIVHVNDATTGDKFLKLMQRALRDGSSRNMLSDLKGKLAIA